MLVPITFFLMIFGIVVGAPIARAYARRVERSGPTLPQLGEMMAKMERMEQTMDAIATEVERISEAQRFTTKLLTAAADAPHRVGAGGA